MSERTLWSHDIELEARLDSISRARAFVRQHLAEHGLADHSADVQLVASELATNAVVHAQTAFTVLLHASDQTLRLEIEDGSRAGPSRLDAEATDTHGRGLAIVSNICRDWGVDTHPKGKSVWAEFALD